MPSHKRTAQASVWHTFKAGIILDIHFCLTVFYIDTYQLTIKMTIIDSDLCADNYFVSYSDNYLPINLVFFISVCLQLAKNVELVTCTCHYCSSDNMNCSKMKSGDYKM